MAITFDASSVGSDSGTNSLTISHTIGSGSNRVLVVCAGIIAGGARTISSVTYNGTACTLSGAFPDGDDNRFVALYYMDEANLPSTGAYDIVITWSGTGNLKGGGVSFSGAAQTGEEATSTGADGFAAVHNDTITTVANNAFVVQATIQDGDTAMAPDDGQTERQEHAANSDTFHICTLSVATAGATNIGVSWGAASGYSSGGASWAPAAAVFSSGPSLSSDTTGGHVINVTITGADATCYWVAIPKGDTAPNATQIAAGQNGDSESAASINGASGSKALTADSADTITITGLTRPVHDLYFVVDDNTASLTNEQKLPPTNYTYWPVTLGGAPPSGSLCDSSSVTGDTLEVKSTCTPDAVGITVAVDGTFSFDDTTTGRQSFTYRQYDVSALDFFDVNPGDPGDYVTVYVNNEAPTAITSVPSQDWYTNVAIDDLTFEGIYVQDAENDILTATVQSGTLPTGVSINQDVDDKNFLTGTPTDSGTSPVVIRFTDVADDYIDISVAFTMGTGVAVPAISSQDESDYLDDIDTAGLSVDLIAYVDNNVVSIGYVESVSPSAGTYVIPGSSVDLVVEGVVVQNVVGETQASGTSTIEGDGLTVVISNQYSSSVDSGDIISQFPNADDIVRIGSDVTLSVSIGSAPTGSLAAIHFLQNQFFGNLGTPSPSSTPSGGSRARTRSRSGRGSGRFRR